MNAGLYSMIGQHTAANYIDECVLRASQEPDVLYRILVKMSGEDEESRAELRGFADYLHQMLEARYGNR